MTDNENQSLDLPSIESHPQSGISNFFGFEEGDSYFLQFVSLLDDLSTHILVEVQTEQELIQYSDMIQRPLMGLIKRPSLTSLAFYDPDIMDEVIKLFEANDGEVTVSSGGGFGGDVTVKLEDGTELSGDDIENLVLYE